MYASLSWSGCIAFVGQIVDCLVGRIDQEISKWKYEVIAQNLNEKIRKILQFKAEFF